MQKSISFTLPLLGAAMASGTAGDSEAGSCPTLAPHSGGNGRSWQCVLLGVKPFDEGISVAKKHSNGMDLIIVKLWSVCLY